MKGQKTAINGPSMTLNGEVTNKAMVVKELKVTNGNGNQIGVRQADTNEVGKHIFQAHQKLPVCERDALVHQIEFGTQKSP